MLFEIREVNKPKGVFLQFEKLIEVRLTSLTLSEQAIE